ncbi:ankyrin repeat-containing domain protein [Rhodocollybia butyracea]|uniref:Ankyrin repeat-containing domain protein n=1 Tax=Rhodocollybia butyracea TaxID=206335 RepID=A0A9P5U7N0_9AGAR|nr:ankyrin repeat-containing domain protein [Rhodocollybia butyracea]
MNWNPSRLSLFGQACYRGQLETIVGLYSCGQAPPLNGFETPFRWGYLSIIIFGAQRSRTLNASAELSHLECLEFLLSHGAPPDLKDIVGYTALHHACISPTTSERAQQNCSLVRTLIRHGANVDHQNRYGEVALFCAFPANNFGLVDILLENGASLDIAEAEGLIPRGGFVRYGPQVTACVTKWIRQREGINAPREGGQKRCGNPGCRKLAGEKDGKNVLKVCGRCCIERYCSTDCQKQAWKTHKKICKPFNTSTTIVLKPSYGENLMHLQPIANLTRNLLGIEQDSTPKSRPKTGHVPRTKPGKEFESKNLIVKVQVALSSYATTIQGRHSFDKSGDLLVYDKRRDFICTIKRSEQGNGTSSAEVCGGEKAFDKLVEVVQEKGIGGSKAYFAAVLKSEKELVIKVEDVLAEQPF